MRTRARTIYSCTYAYTCWSYTRWVSCTSDVEQASTAEERLMVKKHERFGGSLAGAHGQPGIRLPRSTLRCRSLPSRTTAW